VALRHMTVPILPSPSIGGKGENVETTCTFSQNCDTPKIAMHVSGNRTFQTMG
jgi:hypothetical protein